MCLVSWALLLSGLVGSAWATPGALDSTFGNGGLAINQFAPPGALSLATDVALAPEGKIVTAGVIEEEIEVKPKEMVRVASMFVARYLPDGALDPSFGTGGVVTLQPSTFATPYSVVEFSGLAVMPDGRIVIAGVTSDSEGHRETFVGRLLASGALDPTFAGGYVARQLSTAAEPAKRLSEFLGVIVEGNGSVIATGTAANSEGKQELVVERFESNGASDASFAVGGVYRHQWGLGSSAGSVGSDLIQRPDGTLLISGAVTEAGTNEELALLNLTAAGSPNLGFGSGGMAVYQPSEFPGSNTVAYRVAEQPGGDIVLGGTASFNAEGAPAFVAARFTSGGEIDPSFGTHGATLLALSSSPEPSSQAVGLVVQPDGRLVLSGIVTVPQVSEEPRLVFTLARLTANGELDPTFGEHGVLQHQLEPGANASSVGLGEAIDQSGKLLVAGAAGISYGSLGALLTRIELDTPPSVTVTGPSFGCFGPPQPNTYTANVTDSEDPISSIDWEISGNGQFNGGSGTTLTVPPAAITAPVRVRVTNADGISTTVSAPPVEVPPCPPPPHPTVTLLGKSLTMSSRGDIVLRLSATGPFSTTESLSGTATLTAVESVKTKTSAKHKKAKTQVEKVVLGSVHFKATTQGTISLTLHLGTSAQALVRRDRSLKGTIALKASGNGFSEGSSVSVTIKPAKAKPKHSHKHSK